ncbi:MAG: substrate-binding domain-containing protein [Planctomycetaceae bacterium]|nr:substrate-binding domain-containing protein [Planctomycetaceae bacterium]
MRTTALSRRILVLGLGPYDPVAMALTDWARQRAWAMIFSKKDGPLAGMVRQWQADAVIVGANVSTQDMRRWPRGRVPMVWLHDLEGRRYGAGSVLLDHYAAGRLAARHFVDMAFRHLAYCWLGDLWMLNRQLEGFRQAAQEGGCTVHTLDWPRQAAKGLGASYSVTFRRWLVKQVAALPKPLGLMVESDWTGLEALTGLRETGVLVPDEVAIVSCYNIAPVCEGALVPLTSVDMNWPEQGRQAIEMMDRLFQGEEPPAEPLWVAPQGVVPRQSSDVVAVPHMGVAKAMHMIRRDFRDDSLTVGRMARTIGISSFALNWAFRKYLGRSPGEQLRQWRLREAMSLLATTKRKIKDIAAACGYGTVDQFIRCVRAATGQSPAAWRKKQL